jgi:lytic murein transglycosylase
MILERDLRISLMVMAIATAALLASPAHAAQCGNSADGFAPWLAGFRQEAASEGISQPVIETALGNVSYDRAIITRDRGQGVFRLSFEQFSHRLVTPARIARGKSLLQSHAALFRQIEQRYGVPGPVLVAIWGLETGFGADNGKFQIFRSLATLAYDCRRSERFQAELIDALKIVQRGDMSPSQMRGDWAGEIGQTQFLPSSYLKFAVDFNGDGTRDLIHDTTDVLASTANFLQGSGWQRGAGWDEGQPNFAVLLEWNKARVYAKTLAFFADTLAGGAGRGGQ